MSEEEKKKALADAKNSQPMTVVGKLSLRAVCVDKTSGKLLHDIEVLSKERPDPVHTLNSYASPTPVIENGKLFCHFGTNGTACVDTRTQKVLWRNTELQINHENGAGSTPILWKSRLIIHFDGSDLQYIAALDTRDGSVAWKTDRSGKLLENVQMRKAYGTPLVVEMDGKPVVVSPAADWVYGYDPATGEELWKLKYGVLGFSTIPRPISGHGMVYMCTSFMRSQLLAIRYRDENGPVTPHFAWRYMKQVSQQPSPILVGDGIYFVSDKGGILTCLDAKTGATRWKKPERLGGNFSASPILADGLLYFFNREGITTIVRPGEEFEKVAENKIDGRIMASVAAVDGAIFLRSDTALYRIEKSADDGNAASGG
jgi:outer membrane protein assembly factor BamB